MQRKLLVKALTVALLGLLLLIPLASIDGLIGERRARQEGVVAEIAASYAGAQRIVGPVLVLPYIDEYRTLEKSEDGRDRREVTKRESHAVYLFPESLEVDGDIATDFKRRGLFKALVFDLRGSMRGRFRVPQALPLSPRNASSVISFGEPYLALGVDDPRGLSTAPRLKWDGKAYGFERGGAVPAIAHPLRASLPPIEAGKPHSFEFSLELGVRGTESLALVPLADDTRVSLRSGWPHPSFHGRFLPDPQNQYAGADGFRATWHITALASQAREQFLGARGAADGQHCASACLESLGLSFVEPVNIYSQSDRAIKYGFLFVGLAFGAFLLFEILKNLPIHPAQYLLVGLALAIFFLLLLSLSEHVPFASAYLAAALASTALLGFYLGHVLRSARRGAAFGTLMGLLYGALYGLLVSEDNALVMGSALLFGLLAVAMWTTRNFDWYQLAPQAAPAAQQQ